MPVLLHLTAAYSNAVLVAILPCVSDTAKKLYLPIEQPITMNQVARFNVSPYKDYIGGGIWLTNGYWFVYSFGVVDGFRSPSDIFAIQDADNFAQFIGKDNMTTNEAIDLARRGFENLGYAIRDFCLDKPPTTIQGPSELKGLGHVPFCSLLWEIPEPSTNEEKRISYSVRFDVDMQRKQIVGMSLSGTNFWRSNLVIDVVPETEIEFRRKQQRKVTFSTNAPKSILKEPAKQLQQSETNAIKLDFR